MADALNQQCTERVAGVLNHGVAIVAFFRHETHLDEFVRGERAIDFREHGIGKSVRAGLHDDIQVVREAAQIFTMLVGQFGIGHGFGLENGRVAYH